MTLPDDPRRWPADAREALAERVAIMMEGEPEFRLAVTTERARRRVIAEWARRRAGSM